MEVLEPQELREALARQVRQMTRAYGARRARFSKLALTSPGAGIALFLQLCYIESRMGREKCDMSEGLPGQGRDNMIRRTARVLEIIQQIATRPHYWSRRALAECHEIGERMIQKDLEIIRHR